jgi:Cd2+/Zn2+-exporting ATPase
MSESCCVGCDSEAPQPRPVTAPEPAAPWLTLEFWRMSASAAAIVAGMLTSSAGSPVIGAVLYVVAIALTIGSPGRRAWQAIRARSLDINVLMVAAVAGAAILGEWAEAAAVVWLFGASQWLESRSVGRARRAIRSLMRLAPADALVRRDGREQRIAAADLRVGDVVILRPGDRVPIDGVVVAGDSALDQSAVTGESWPVDKSSGDPVYAGTLNGTGALEIRATRPPSDSTLARIIHLVERAQSRRAPVQAYVDRFAKRYTPAVLALALVMAIVPPLVTAGADVSARDFGTWTYRALALLVVACPCALVISTPVSIVSAIAGAARRGVLIKGGASLERLAAVRCVAFDKTGTLTHGRVAVTDVVGVDGVTSDGVLSVAAALEARSEHPIGRAIVSRARDAGLSFSPGELFRSLPGLGAEALVASAPAVVGSHRLFESRQLCTPALHARLDELEQRGAMPVLVSHAGAPLGVIGLADELRGGGRETVARLRRAGVARVVMLTGDTGGNAAAIARAAGVDEAHADLLPGDKVAQLSRLRAAHGAVAMVGDGVNDAPALAAADVGIAMGAAGSDVALETADVALMSDDLSKLPYVIRLGRRTLSRIRQNVALAIGLKLAFVVLAAAGVATIWMAVVADTGASLIVTANALRLLRDG